MHIGLCKNAESALSLFGRQRTSNGKGVTIQSQMRYVRYYQTWLNAYLPRNLPFPFFQAITIKGFRFSTACAPSFAEYVTTSRN
jgi:hypothetical protein